MLTQHIALVPEAAGVDPSELARVSAALQKQVTRDFSAAWGILATVDTFPYLEDVPVGYWPIIIGRGELGGHEGVHIDGDGQPYALVRAVGSWSLAASRACLEMLVNPFESRSVSAPSIRSDQAPVEFLVEVCAPCEDERTAYVVDGIAVSDFCLPAFFGDRTAQANRYSWTGSLSAPFALRPGGHITWYDPVANSWWMRNHWGENAVDTNIGVVDRKRFSVRALVQVCAPWRSLASGTGLTAGAAQTVHSQSRRASQVRAHRLRSMLCERLDGERLGHELDAAVDAALVLDRVVPDEADEPEIEIEYDFEDDETTLVTAEPKSNPVAPPPPKRPAPARAANTAPFPAPPRAPTRAEAPAHPRTADVRPERAPSVPKLPSLAPISIAVSPEPSVLHARLAGAALALAAVALIAFGLRVSTPDHAPRAAATSPAHAVPAPAEVPEPAAPPAPPAATPSPTSNVAVAVPSHDEHAAPIAPSARPQPRAAQRRPAPRTAPPSPSSRAADAIDDLIDTRR